MVARLWARPVNSGVRHASLSQRYRLSLWCSPRAFYQAQERNRFALLVQLNGDEGRPSELEHFHEGQEGGRGSFHQWAV